MVFTRRLTVFVGLALVLLGAGCATSTNRVDGVKTAVSKEERARLILEVANASLLEGDPTTALEHLREAEAVDASLPELHHSKALAYSAKKDFKKAIESARKAVQIKPNYAGANITLGKLLLDQGSYEEAQPFLEVAANDATNREAYKANTGLGILYYRRGQIEKATRYLDLAIEDGKERACVAYYYKGHIALKKGRFQESLGQYESASKNQCVNFSEGHLALGMAYEKVKRFDLARKKYLEIQTRYPNSKMAQQAVERLRYLP